VLDKIVNPLKGDSQCRLPTVKKLTKVLCVVCHRGKEKVWCGRCRSNAQKPTKFGSAQEFQSQTMDIFWKNSNRKAQWRSYGNIIPDEQTMEIINLYQNTQENEKTLITNP